MYSSSFNRRVDITVSNEDPKRAIFCSIHHRERRTTIRSSCNIYCIQYSLIAMSAHYWAHHLFVSISITLTRQRWIGRCQYTPRSDLQSSIVWQRFSVFGFSMNTQCFHFLKISFVWVCFSINPHRYPSLQNKDGRDPPMALADTDDTEEYDVREDTSGL